MGALQLRAAAHYGAGATGCTLCSAQLDHRFRKEAELPPGRRVTALDFDFRDLDGCFAKIHSLRARDGLFLNHGIARRCRSAPDGQSLFLQRKVFPGTALVTLPEVIGSEESAGLEVLDLENIHPNYALTCRAWVRNPQQKAAECRRLVGDETFCTWLLYLAGSAVNFKDGYLDVHQILLMRKDDRTRRLTRDYMFPALPPAA